jgi:ABC-type oligopeptide transport system substrate-binding subunit
MRRFRMLIVVVLTALLVACSGAPAGPAVPTEEVVQGAPAPQPAPPVAQAVSLGTLITTLGSRDPTTLDPALVGDVVSAMVIRQLFTGLVRLDATLEVQPDIAGSWDVSPDGLIYTFYLRPDARFADGTPITARDVIYSLERAADPQLTAFPPAATYLNDIIGVAEKLAGQADTIRGLEQLDQFTVQITIDAPKAYFLAKLAHPTSFVVDRRAVERGGDRWTAQPNGSGPFTIERWDNDRLLVLVRNLNFYREQAKVDRVRFLMGADAANPLVLYEQGRIDLTGVPGFALARVQDPTNPLSAELVSVPQLSVTYIGMNVNLPPFDDPLVREAFSLVLDRERLANVTLRGGAQMARGILPPGIPGYNPDLPEPVANAERARQLLAASRYGGPAGLPPIAVYGSWASTLREVVERDLGVTMEVRGFEQSGAFFEALKRAEFQIYGTGWVADYPDPENFLDVLFRSGATYNYAGYSNPAVDILLNQAAIATDEQERFRLYQQAEQLILADAAVIPLYHNIDHTLIKPYVRGLNVTPLGILDFSTAELIR